MQSKTDQLKERLNEAFEKHAQGDNIEWDVALMPVGPNGPMFVVLGSMNGALLGQKMLNVGMLPFSSPIDQEAIDRAVSELLENLRNARSEELTETKKLVL